MCGILGTVYNKNKKIVLDTILNSSLQAMHHRGPNDKGYERLLSGDHEVILGQTRLSVIDLSIGGHQPIYSHFDKRYCMVFNGEIYNYKELKEQLQAIGHTFTTQSDTEVLLAAWIEWGESCLKSLKGMFAFVVHDSVAGTVTCVRDAFGIKPFFYHQGTEEFSFASEVQALKILISEKITINNQRAYDYLVHGNYDDEENTFFNEVKHLPPASILTININKNSSDIKKWWWPSITERNDLTFDAAAQKVREIFLENIKLHLRSDVPLGIALSGGLDSSAVACAVRYLYPTLPINTFTYVARGTDVDEEKWADIINTYINAIPHKVEVKSSELLDDLDDMIYHQGEPFGGTSIYASYRVFKLAKEAGMTVTLDGQGADELLAGYNGYPGQRMLSLFQTYKYIELLKFLYYWSLWPNRSLAHGLKMFLQALIPIEWQNIPRKLIGKSILPKWIEKYKIVELKINPNRSLINQFKIESEVGRALMARLRHTMTGGSLSNLLRHGDRNSMRWSIESRVPFLTVEMAEFLLSLPENYLISNRGETKHIFKHAMRGIVPDEILNRKDKIGFALPEKNILNETYAFAIKRKVLGNIDFVKKDAPTENEIYKFLSINKINEWRYLNLNILYSNNQPHDKQ